MFTTHICDIVRRTTCVERPAPIARRVRRSNLDQLLDQRFSNDQGFALAVQCNTRPITTTETVQSGAIMTTAECREPGSHIYPAVKPTTRQSRNCTAGHEKDTETLSANLFLFTSSQGEIASH